MADTSTQTTISQPWDPQGNALAFGYSEAQNTYKNRLNQGFPGYSDATQQGLSSLEAIAKGGNPFLGPAQDAVTGIASGANGLDTGNLFSGIYGNSQQSGSLAGGVYGNIASGGMLNGNPYADAILQKQQDDIANQVKAAYSTAGRYGSNNFTNALATSLGNNANAFNLGRYDTDMSNLLRAAEGQSQENLSLQNLGLSAAQGLTGVQQQNLANRLGAAQLSPTISEMRYSDPTYLSQVGAARDAQKQAEGSYGQNVLADYMGLLGSVPGSSGVSTSTATTPSTASPSSWLGALGGAATGAGIGSIFGPVGTAIGAGLGGLGSFLFG